MFKKKPQKAYIVRRTLYAGNSIREAVFKNYKDAKKEYEELLKIWKADGFFKDDESRIIENEYSFCEMGNLKIIPTTLYS